MCWHYYIYQHQGESNLFINSATSIIDTKTNMAQCTSTRLLKHTLSMMDQSLNLGTDTSKGFRKSVSAFLKRSALTGRSPSRPTSKNSTSTTNTEASAKCTALAGLAGLTTLGTLAASPALTRTYRWAVSES
jgi:hypothetical protein